MTPEQWGKHGKVPSPAGQQHSNFAHRRNSEIFKPNGHSGYDWIKKSGRFNSLTPWLQNILLPSPKSIDSELHARRGRNAGDRRGCEGFRSVAILRGPA